MPRIDLARPALSLAVALAAFGLHACALADTDEVVIHNLCEAPRSAEPPRSAFAIGCEVIDAGLGCGADSALKLRIQFDGPPGAEARLNISSRQAPLDGLVIPETARRVDDSTIAIRPGVTVISGFRGGATPAPLVRPAVDVPKKWLSKLSNLPPSTATGRVTLAIDQLVGNLQVRRHVVNYVYPPCVKAQFVTDRIKVTDNASARRAIVLFDGQQVDGECISDGMGFGMSQVGLGNMVPPSPGCRPSRATVFSAQNAIEYRPSINPQWTAQPTDLRPIELGALLVQPVKLWLLYDACFDKNFSNRFGQRECYCQDEPYASQPGCSAACATPASASDPQCDLARLRRLGPRLLMNKARTLYLEQFGGIGFADEFVDLSTITNTDTSPLGTAVRNARAVPGCTSTGTANATLPLVNAVKTAAEPGAPQRLDVYMVRAAAANGVWCGASAAGAAVILLDSAYRETSLAHEFGHAFLNIGQPLSNHVVTGANHGFENNLMQSLSLAGGGERLTLGQLFRATVDANSSINRHPGVRPGKPTENCEELSSSDKCPAAWCDVERQNDSTLTGKLKCAPLP